MTEPSDGLDPPHALVVDDEAISRDFAALVLRASGWRVDTAASGAAALTAMTASPDLILMDLRMEGMCGIETTAAIRLLDGAGSVPILAYTTVVMDDPATLHASGFDGYVRKPCDPDELAAIAADWRPAGASALRRLGEVFGADHIQDLADRFAALLVEALAALDRGDAAAIAHRVAGAAGTLGFAEAGDAWLQLSEGNMLSADEVRRQSRRALAALAHSC